jgi:hypothetical protein
LNALSEHITALLKENHNSITAPLTENQNKMRTRLSMASVDALAAMAITVITRMAAFQSKDAPAAILIVSMFKWVLWQNIFVTTSICALFLT